MILINDVCTCMFMMHIPVRIFYFKQQFKSGHILNNNTFPKRFLFLFFGFCKKSASLYS